MADSKKDTLEILAVGRPFQLGMLYDCRNEKLIPGITLWDPDILKGNINSSKKPSVEYDVITSDSIDDKSSAMDISASMKASFCSGLIDISGSASYLSNQKQSRRQSRVTLKYKTTTRFEQLTMQHLGKGNAKHQDVFDQGTATHVVTGILYGAQAFFVFDRKFSESSEEQEIKGDLEVIINKIPLVKISGDGNLNMNDGERSKVEEFHCQFHGDFIIDTNPVNYEDAVKLYHDLPNKVGKDGTNGVPLKVWLYPLHLLDSSAAKLVRDISVNVISNVSSAYEELVNLESQLNDLKGHTVPCKFTSIKDKVTWFQKMVTEFKTHFQRNLAESLPRIRGGGMEEQVLVDLLLRRDKSPFSTEKLVKWISNLEHEINLMEAYLENLKDIHQVTKAGEIDRLATRNEHVFCFTFGQLSQSEPLLLSMSSYLAGNNVKETTEDKKAWFHNPEIKKCIRKRSMQFADFVNDTRPTLDSFFVVSSSDDGEKTVGARVIHYKEGEVVDSDFKPPSAPGKPSIDSVDHDQIGLTWEEPENGCCNVESYSVKFTDLGCTDDPRTHTHEVEKGTSATVNNLKPNTQYVFEIIAKCDGGLSPASIKSDVVLTKPCSPPGIPSLSNALSSKLTICWQQPTVIAEGEVIKLYKVKCLCIVNNQVVAEESTSTSTLFTNLMPGTEYSFSVTAVCSSGTSNSSGAITMETLSNISTVKLISAKLLVPRTHKGSPEIYAIPLEENMRDTEKNICKMQFGKPREFNTPSSDKVIMMVGATGSGKTTLINGMINYLFDVKWEDNYRFKLIHDEKDAQGNTSEKSQVHCQTKWITAYSIYHTGVAGSRVPYNLTVIDTPGFGDTSGKEEDRKIIQQIDALFQNSHGNGIDHIDVIGFVVQSALARLTYTQKFVFDSILSLFGKDIAENIFTIVTFCDGQDPPVIASIKEHNMPYRGEHFKFNNSALFVSNTVTDADKDEYESFDYQFWRMGMQSMKKFFKALAAVDQKSLQMSKDVLRERRELEVTLEGLHSQIQSGLSKLEEIKQDYGIMKDNEAKIEANKDFKYKVKMRKPYQKDISQSGLYNTNCQTCYTTCHYPCGIANDNEKARCTAMKHGSCTNCPGKCAWSVHFNQKYVWEYREETVERNSDEIYERYRSAKEGKNSCEEMLKKNSDIFKWVKNKVIELMEKSRDHLNRLKAIALKPDPLSVVEYIDLMIEGEKQEKKPGFQKRVATLQELRARANLGKQALDPSFNPWGNFELVEVETKKGKTSFMSKVKNLFS